MALWPAVFPDGQPLSTAVRVLDGLVRRHFRGCAETKTPVSWLEKAIATLLGYWAVPSHHCSPLDALSGAPGHARISCMFYFSCSVSAVATGLPSLVKPRDPPAVRFAAKPA